MRPYLHLCHGLVGKAVAHDKTRMSGGAAEIDQASFCQQDDVFSVDRVFIDLRLDLYTAVARIFIEPSHVDLVVEVSDIAHNGLVLHLLKVLTRNDVLVARGVTTMSIAYYSIQLFDGKTIHSRLQRTNRVDL